MKCQRRALAAAACMLAASAGLARSEDYRVTIKIGTEPVVANGDARGFARYYLNYAAHAVESYRGLEDQDTSQGLFGNYRKLAPWPATTEQETSDRRRLAGSRLHARGWRFAGGYSGPLPCQPDDPACFLRPVPVKGLEYQFWKRKGCRNIAIVFRGTDPTSSSDWYSNFRWVTRVLPFADEYDQVRRSIKKIIKDARKVTDCRDAKIIAVGHSLGGGLAQLAAYSDNDIKRVYAFDPSPVTAIYDIDQLMREGNAKELVIDRVYEKGEILSWLRRAADSFYQPSACNPQVRTAEFNTVTGFTFAINPISQHSIERLWSGLFDFAGKANSKLKLPGFTGNKPVGCDVKIAKAQGGKFARAGHKQRLAKHHKPRTRHGLKPSDRFKTASD